MVDHILQKLKIAGQKSLDILFKPSDVPSAKWIVVILLGILFTVGILHWGYILTWFGNHFDIGDWHRIDEPILVFLTKAFRSGQLPLHGDSPLFIPDRYLGRPNRPLSPQFLLLYFLEPAKFVVINVWLFYSVGFIGLLLIRRRYHLSLVSFTALFLLFNFNGHITDHYVVGHLEWVGYFLLPFYVLLILQMAEGDKIGWRWVFNMAMTMLVINLQGAYHFYLWCMAFLLFFVLFQPGYWILAVKAIIASLLLSMIRLLPPAIEYYNSGGVQFIFGFFSVVNILESFAILHSPYLLDTPSGQLGGWELDYYLGLIGFLFMIYFGVIKNWVNGKSYRHLYFPMLVMAFFSMGDMYRPIFNSPIPFMDSQRAPTRFIIIPVVFLITLASLQFQTWIKSMNSSRWIEKVAILFGLTFIGYDLFEHSRTWRLSNLTTKILERYTDVIQVNVVNRPDPPYILAIVIGLSLTILSLLVLACLSYREKRIGLKILQPK